jgi:hypothetical protein
VNGTPQPANPAIIATAKTSGAGFIVLNVLMVGLVG